MTTAARQAYEEAVAEFVGIYGDKTVVASMMGSMYNFFGEQAEIANRVSGLQHTSKDMAGFPTQSLEHWCKLFTDQGYVFVVMDQQVRRKKNGCEEFYRVPVAVYGPGAPIELPYDCDSATCAVVFLDDDPSRIGYATFETNTGKTQASEFVEEAFETAFTSMLSSVLADAPAHTLVICSDTQAGSEALNSFKRRAGSMRVFGKRVDYRSENPVTLKESHIRQTIREQFDGCGLMTGSEDTYIGLKGRRFAAVAFAHLVHFVFRRDDTKLRIMEPPILVSPHAYLDIAIGGLKQLDITCDDGLFGSLPSCCTKSGRRAFRQRVCRPDRDPSIMERRLCLVDACLDNWKEVRECLKSICDFESLYQKMSRAAAFRSGYFVNIVRSMETLKRVSRMVIGPRGSHPADAVIKEITRFIDIDRTIDEAAYVAGVDPELDSYTERYDEAMEDIQGLLRHLNICSGGINDAHFKLESGKDDVLDISVSQKKFEAARRELKKREAEFWIIGRRVFCPDLVAQQHKTRKNDKVLHSEELREALSVVRDVTRTLKDMRNKLHETVCQRVRETTHDAVYMCARELEDIDIAATCAMMARERGFVRPQIQSGVESFVDAKGLRHPIVESKSSLVEYVGNDVRLDDDYRGMLLFGINGSGKSCLMKSLGIAVCMAQAGMYVCADEMTISPFASLFTRIWNNDDINRGMSTFTVEMTELGEILRRGDSMSLVLGDELCSGTERVSATAIITAGVEMLERARCRFLLATHQHDVLDRISHLDTVFVRHLAVRLEPDGKLVYERRLRRGRGETNYGVTVCGALGMPPDFIEAARRHSREAMGVESGYSVSVKKSNYNPDVYMGICSRCGVRPSVHTHHRIPQALAPVRVKNAAFNLEALCAECHVEHHKSVHHARTRVVNTSAGVMEIPLDIA